MKEKACQFGPDLNLFGILCEPGVSAGPTDRPFVLMLNAGLVHHVGPHRMSVDLARQLAALGVSSLRFDLGGRGDSQTSRTADSDEQRVQNDISDALNFLERKLGARRFVLFGLCAGADNAHAAALRDARIVGAIFLDGHAYWTWRSYVEHYLPRLGRPRAWLNYARRVLAPGPPVAGEFGVHGQRRPFGARRTVEGELQTLVDRGARLLFVYTGGVSYYYNYASQFADMFGGLNTRGQIEVEHYPKADHTYTFAEDRERLFKRLLQWFAAQEWHGV